MLERFGALTTPTPVKQQQREVVPRTVSFPLDDDDSSSPLGILFRTRKQVHWSSSQSAPSTTTTRRLKLPMMPVPYSDSEDDEPDEDTLLELLSRSEQQQHVA
jgi:hypothetical protein